MSTTVTVPATTGQEQILQFPTWFRHKHWAIEFSQFILGFVIWWISLLGVVIEETWPGLCLMLATACVTAIGAILYHFLYDDQSTKLHHCWAAIVFDTFLLVMWIMSVVLFAPETARIVAGFKNYGTGKLLLAIFLLIAEVMGGLAIIIYAISLGVRVFAVYRHRKAGLHPAPIPLRNVPATRPT